MKSKSSSQTTQTYMCKNEIISTTGNKSRNSIKICNTSADCNVLNDTQFGITDLTLLSKQIKSQTDYTDIIREIQKHNFCARLGISKPFIKVVLCKAGATTDLLNNNYEVIGHPLGEITEDTVVFMYTETIDIRPIDLIVSTSLSQDRIDHSQTSVNITSAIKKVSNKLKGKGVLHQDLKLEHVGKDKSGDLFMIDFEDVYVEELDKQNNGLIQYSYIFHCVLLAMYAKYLFIVNGIRIDYADGEACILFEHKKIPDFCKSIKEYNTRGVWCIIIIQYYFSAINTFFLRAKITISDNEHTLLSSSTPNITDNQQKLASVLIECFFTDIKSLDYLDPDNEFNSNNIEYKANEKKDELRHQLETYVKEILKEKNKQIENINRIKKSKKNMFKPNKKSAYPGATGRNPSRAALIGRSARLRQQSKSSGSNGGSPKTRKKKFRKNKLETHL